jgi:hypothetical protein
MSSGGASDPALAAIRVDPQIGGPIPDQPRRVVFAGVVMAYGGVYRRGVEQLGSSLGS